MSITEEQSAAAKRICDEAKALYDSGDLRAAVIHLQNNLAANRWLFMTRAFVLLCAGAFGKDVAAITEDDWKEINAEMRRKQSAEGEQQ